MPKQRRQRSKPDSTDTRTPQPSGIDQELLSKNGLKVLTIEITERPIPDPVLESLSEEVRAQIQDVTHRMYEQPASLCKELASLVKAHPHVPILRNHLGGAFSAAGRYKKASRTFRELYELFPEYLFGFCNHVLVMLAEDRIEEAEAVVEKGPRGPLLSPMAFEPERSVFHISEVTAYAAMVGRYLYLTERDEAALVQLDLLQQLAPDSPQTQQLADLFEIDALADDVMAILFKAQRKLARGTR